MKRAQINFMIDTVAFAGFVFLTTTGVLLRYLLPPGSGRFATLLGLDRHEWGTIHFWVSIIFFAVLALHLILHWRWIVGLLSGHKQEGSGLRLGLGLLGALTLIALALAPLVAPVEISDAPGMHNRPSQSETSTINGSMSLHDLERATGVPSDYMLEQLNIPKSTDRNRKLGQLRRQYGFSIATVRKIVEDYPD